MSVIKQITYREHLPALLGPEATSILTPLKMTRSHKRPNHTRFVKLTEEDILAERNGRFKAPADNDPSIRQEFVTAAYRFGHAMVPDVLKSTDSSLSRSKNRNLKDNYFDPDMVVAEGPGACLRGAMMAPANTVSGAYADATQNNLFKPNNFKHGVDLLSINLAVKLC